MRPALRPLALLCALPLLLLGTGCENTIEPFSDAGHYSVRGYLDLGAPFQYIRVRDLQVPIEQDTARTFSGRVFLDDLNAGTSEELRDRVRYLEGALTHNFYTATPVRGNTTYRLRVVGNDGVETRATTTTPPDEPPTFSKFYTTCGDPVHVTFPQGAKLFSVEIGYY